MRFVILDLETLPISNAAEFIAVDNIEAPEHYVKPEAIEKFIAKEKAKRIDRAALDLDLARLCCVGFAYVGVPGVSPDCHALLTQTEDLEKKRIGKLAEELAPERNTVLVTFNGNRYDLPLLMRRAKYLGVPFPRLNLDRYRSPHIDLYDELTMKGAIKAHSLRWYMRRHGWTDLLDADPLKNGGADVACACQEGRWDDIAAHALVDIKGTLRLAQWMGVVSASVPETAGAF